METIRETWNTFIAGGVLNGQPRPLIRESWLRSRSAAVEPVPQGAFPRRVADSDLHDRLNANADIIAATRPHLEFVHESLGAAPHAVCLTDAEGIVLLALGEGRSPGEDWSEGAAGTNGAGLALHAGGPVALSGAEHFAQPLHDRASAAAPIVVADQTVGAIDIISSAEAADHALLAGHVALAIGRQLSHRASPPVSRSTIADLVPVFIASCDRQRRYKFVNRGYAERHGRKPEQFVGKTVSEMVGEEAYQSFKDHIDLV